MQSMLSKVVLVAVCALCASASGLDAQTNFAVDVAVSCEDPGLGSLVRSFFSRELRELGDVRVGEATAPDYRVEVVAVRIGRHGWAMSVVITVPFDGGAAAGLDPELAASLGAYGRTIEHSLTRGDSSEDLGREISQIAKALDTEFLKPRRKELKRK